MQTPVSASTPDRILRECDCPPWVERCAHIDGHWLTLHRDNTAEELWSVCGDSGPQVLSQSGNIHEWPRETWRIGLSLEAALAAFHEAEEALLRGEL